MAALTKHAPLIVKYLAKALNDAESATRATARRDHSFIGCFKNMSEQKSVLGFRWTFPRPSNCVRTMIATSSSSLLFPQIDQHTGLVEAKTLDGRAV